VGRLGRSHAVGLTPSLGRMRSGTLGITRRRADGFDVLGIDRTWPGKVVASGSVSHLCDRRPPSSLQPVNAPTECANSRCRVQDAGDAPALMLATPTLFKDLQCHDVWPRLQFHKSCFERLTRARRRMVELDCSMELFPFGSKSENQKSPSECSFGCRQKRTTKGRLRRSTGSPASPDY
jgi:hypothetical protein